MNSRPRKEASKPKKKWQEELDAPSPTSDYELPPSPPPPASPEKERSPTPPPASQRDAKDVFKNSNCVVYFDIEIGGDYIKKGKLAGRIEMELFTADCPRTAENFRALCTGEKGRGKTTGMTLSYEGCAIHRVIPGFMAQGGDFQRGDGTGGESIYGGEFADENFTHKHTTRGLLSMANAGRNTNGSQFFLTFGRAAHLDGKHTVFGRVSKGMEVVDQMEKIGSKDGDPRQQVVIAACGELTDDAPGNSRAGRSPARTEHLSKKRSESPKRRSRSPKRRSRSPKRRSRSPKRRSRCAGRAQRPASPSAPPQAEAPAPELKAPSAKPAPQQSRSPSAAVKPQTPQPEPKPQALWPEPQTSPSAGRPQRRSEPKRRSRSPKRRSRSPKRRSRSSRRHTPSSKSRSRSSERHSRSPRRGSRSSKR
ncbi:hypothetical protein CYMTET_56641 [Cymbomonas tetramitiformis]|uniref:peptidylprolyl isomerase n=1 Tax=Cymbomonas tetramitiformis TaxID=36881 RepID=A0AAE0BBR3_9CHLO|nr:hypothetical protein CYMTET_56641 [Cymbomonas tetramitiformis]